MDDALLMRRLEGLGDLLGNRQRLLDRDRATGNPLRKIFPFDQLHDQRGAARAFLQAVDVRDVRVIQRGEHFRFALKPCEPVWISRE